MKRSDGDRRARRQGCERRRVVVGVVVAAESLAAGRAGNQSGALFAAGYAALPGAVKLVARTRKITPSAEPTVTAKVGMGPVAVGYALTVELKVLLPGLEKSVAEEVVAGAHERCPYSNATRGNIDVKLTVL
jgi:Ohr subfamily peroxiredoxin